MGTIKLLKLVTLLIIVPIFLGASCNKGDTNPCNSGVRYGFEANALFSEEREVYNIGDTIYLNSVIPKNLFDLVSNQTINYENSVGIQTGISFARLDTTLRNFKDAYSNFTAFFVKGSFFGNANVPESGIVAKYQETVAFELALSIIPKEKGIYLIAVGNAYSRGIMGKNCTDAGFNMTVTNTNKHFNLFQYALGYAPDALLAKGIYCFRVQ